MSEAGPESVVIPHTELDPELLRAVLESFVLREGTDYGERELSLDDKVARLLNQIERQEAHIVFDPESNSVTLLPGRAPKSD